MTSAPPTRPLRPLELRLLGTFDVETRAEPADGVHALVRQPKRAALLVFLLLEGDGDPVERERLVELFWPDVDDERGRTSLRQSLTWLRGHLPDGAVVRRGNRAVGIDPALVACDVLRFRRLLDAGRAVEALELYRGDLLEGFPVEAGDAFDGWLEERRSTLRARAAREAWALASRAEAEGRGGEAAFWGKRALSLSVFDEAGAQRLMALLARVGEPGGVLRVYRGLEERLARDGRRPAPLTRRIAEEVRGLEPDEAPVAVEGGGGRRSGVDRRSGRDRRNGEGGWDGDERRTGEPRRAAGERRSGRDRREVG